MINYNDLILLFERSLLYLNNRRLIYYIINFNNIYYKFYNIDNFL